MLEQNEHNDKQPDWYAEEIARIAGLEFAFRHKSELDALQGRGCTPRPATSRRWKISRST